VQADVFRLLQDGNAVAVRLCTRFPGWAVYARKGYLVIELGDPVEREPLEYGSIATKTKVFQEVIDNFNKELFPNKEKATAPKLAFRAQEALGAIDDAPLRLLALGLSPSSTCSWGDADTLRFRSARLKLG